MKKISIEPSLIFFPQPIYIIGTKNPDGSPNFGTVTWLEVTIDNTPHIVMTIGGNKQTRINLLRENKFSANLVSQDMIWLADYLGSTTGTSGKKDKVKYDYTWNEDQNIPILEQSRWIYECNVSKVIELSGSHLFISEIENIQIDETLENIDFSKIDLNKLDPAIYAPFNYYAIGNKIGNRGDWMKYLK
ncbi:MULTISPECIES: flavin reductase family protein [Clostridium]|uniref:Flavin reductase (DIM6/NTAB) family NADH-FMN oxidoreductase RutF n=1 Tax=Clostridium beijerinckii TaxID=1520 RepID=A0A9Q5CS32_CLOBE|nr:flavin reductase family protein [Clostridium beijerinckii]AQS04939.1 flavoredoxin [Clostridium beijerinckii]MBA2885922.1 flavin reductase (DIM6/NTAB) family NADH-FMN oxidoreductase RutF [Clostridium beijerinckii]MBA2900789.1 flavin reductase (DIM6/NTAB) family NADH-FMN oxidoreductase RutF [Clostridium beijerinckii]MBA2910481.1 flavin reductase (DIM6/NTAB) family NADH-FMN oxidoreductase RutF [Clostridium beijerinckii]MBA9015497.1 flavin reductase (DIM6/NTAB) family NADH-FMN oxidoreductase Ru